MSKTILLSPNAEFKQQSESIEKKITKKTKAIIAVHLAGNPCDLESLSKLCNKYNIILIEDFSQAHGAKYKGKRLGSYGHIGCFSCYPTKNLGAIGDAGLITSNSEELAQKSKMLREYGWQDRSSIYSGRNSRLDELQAAILRVKLRHLDSDNQKRIKIADFYYKDSAETMINRIISETSITDPSIKKLSNTKYRVLLGPFNDIKKLEESYNNIKLLNFENLEILKDV